MRLPTKLIVIIWTLAPWPFLAAGLHIFHSIFWSFFLYHGCCLLPAIIWKRHHWKNHLALPSRREVACLLAGSILFSLFTYVAFQLFGPYIFNKQRAIESLTYRGFQPFWLVPLSVYFVTVNPLVEELFWRGVVLNELSDNELSEDDTEPFGLPVLWTNLLFAAWHILVIRLFVAPSFMYIAFCTVMAVGIFLSYLYRRKSSLVLPALWHGLVFDLAVVIILWSVVKSG
jgi:membrane protease YdiL (CAAX protease family)